MFGVLKYSISQLFSIKHSHSIVACLPFSHHLAALLHILLPSSSASPLFSAPLLTFSSEGSCRWVQLWSQPSSGHIQESFIYVWLSYKASNLITEQEPPLPQIIPSTVWWLAGIIIYLFFLPSISSLAPQSCSTAGVLVIINNLEETYYSARAGVKREEVWE